MPSATRGRYGRARGISTPLHFNGYISQYSEDNMHRFQLMKYADSCSDVTGSIVGNS